MGRRRRQAAFDDPPAEALSPLSKPPALDELLGCHEADVVPRPGMLAAGIAEPYDQPVDRPATAAEGASQGSLLPV